MSRKSGKRKRRSRSRPRRQSPSACVTSEYQRGIRQADRVLSANDVEIRADNWQQLAVDWFAADARDSGELSHYIAANESQLGVAWARGLLRLEVFFQAHDHNQIVAHYDRALSRYPRCALVEMWVAEQIARHGGDWWRARPMLLYAADNLPSYARPRYELGFMSYLLGDFPGALDWFNQAAALVADDDAALGSQIFYNRGLVRYAVDGDRQVAIADVQEALRRNPDYPQAKQALLGLRSKARWVPW